MYIWIRWCINTSTIIYNCISCNFSTPRSNKDTATIIRINNIIYKYRINTRSIDTTRVWRNNIINKHCITILCVYSTTCYRAVSRNSIVGKFRISINTNPTTSRHPSSYTSVWLSDIVRDGIIVKYSITYYVQSGSVCCYIFCNYIVNKFSIPSYFNSSTFRLICITIATSITRSVVGNNIICKHCITTNINTSTLIPTTYRIIINCIISKRSSITDIDASALSRWIYTFTCRRCIVRYFVIYKRRTSLNIQSSSIGREGRHIIWINNIVCYLNITSSFNSYSSTFWIISSVLHCNAINNNITITQ